MGVREYKKPEIPNLPVVKHDLESIGRVLEDSGYEIRNIGLDDPKDVTRNTISEELHKACRQTQAGDTLILYFSGHGVHYKGKDYLVPWDATLDLPDLFDEYLEQPAGSVR